MLEKIFGYSGVEWEICYTRSINKAGEGVEKALMIGIMKNGGENFPCMLKSDWITASIIIQRELTRSHPLVLSR